MTSRYLQPYVEQDLEKIVFISGPRQTGKTTLAKILLQKHGYDAPQIKQRYLTWDDRQDREKIIHEHFPAGKGLLVLDEIHKYTDWRRLVKGLYDKRGDELSIVVTGSARLDYYRHGGDSLQGRYFSYRLHGLSHAELGMYARSDFDALFRLGGFPEPFFSGSEVFARRWRRLYRSRFLEELPSLETVKDMGMMEKLVLRLPDLVGSPLSLNSLREDLQVSQPTVSRWMDILERLYHLFRIYPFGAPSIRAVKKEAKHYHYDWGLVKETGARFENMVACHLLKWCHFLEDTQGYATELRYFRDTDRREVDFVVLVEEKPVYFIECKIRDKDTSPHLRYLHDKFPEVPAYQLSLVNESAFTDKHGISHFHVAEFFERLI